MAIRDEFLGRDAQASGFCNLDLAPSARTRASPILPHSPLRAMWQIGIRWALKINSSCNVHQSLKFSRMLMYPDHVASGVANTITDVL